MHGFHEKNGVLHVDNVSLANVAEHYGTPVYVYSASVIRNQYHALNEAMKRAMPKGREPLLCYACKANSNIAVLSLLRSMGAGLEIVSEGELFRGLKAGFTGDKIISTSYGKNEQEIKACLAVDILQFNIEAPEELMNISAFAVEMDKQTEVVFRLNPDIAGGGHSKISTGRKEDKFGNTHADIMQLYKRAEVLPNVTPVGISIHIGSQISQVEAFKPGFEKLAVLVKDLRAAGHSVTHLDIGGGFPIIYNDEKLLDLDAFAGWVNEVIVPLETKIQMEPGRYMVGNAGVLLSRVQYVKKTPSKNFMVLDAGMSDLVRPAMYDAYHDIRPIVSKDNMTEQYDIVGPICESGDMFAKNRTTSEVKNGDVVAIMSAGAYGFSMASNYNSRPLPAEILVDGENIAVISQAQTVQDLIARESIPDWL